jgi:hypothetical protein
MNVSIFSPEQLEQIIQRTLPATPANHSHAVVATVDQNGAQVVASFKRTSHWELQAAAQHEWSGDDSVGARVLLSW